MITMSKSSYFSGEPIFSQLLSFLPKQKVKSIAEHLSSDRYIKSFDSYTHLVTLLYAVISDMNSLREISVGMLSIANKITHLGVLECVPRSTLADANKRRSPEFFEKVYYLLLEQYRESLSDSRNRHLDAIDQKLYAMDSTTIALFKAILKGTGQSKADGRHKGGVKAHTIIKVSDFTPCFVRITAAAVHDHTLLSEVNIPAGSYLVFDKGYVDYAVYEDFTRRGITYVTKLKSNAKSSNHEDINRLEDKAVLIDERMTIQIPDKGDNQHVCRRIAYWDKVKNKVNIFLTNNMDLSAYDVVEIYLRRWKIETLYKQMKQNFPLKYFLGDNENAIRIQIWVTLIANLLLTMAKSLVHRKWAFSNMVTFVRQRLMDYINLYLFLEDPEKSWIELQRKRRERAEQLSEMDLFYDTGGLHF
jgi:hypothetical protein